MSMFPTAQILKVIDPKTSETKAYQVAVLSDGAAPFNPGKFRTLRGALGHGFRNLLPAEARGILGAALGVAGPVQVTVGWWFESIERRKD